MKTEYILVLYFGMFTFTLFAHDQAVHQAITINAAESALDDSIGYAEFLNTVFSDMPLSGNLSATNFMVIGSYDEDFTRDKDPIGGYRSLNHFYDPTKSPPIGLTDRGWLLSHASIGRDSFTWASISNSPAVDSSIESGKYNIWSWQNARDYEWLGLTATSQSERQTNLASMFLSVGQVMHLLEDNSQPQHVRNEAHLDQIPYLKVNLWSRSAIEDYYKTHPISYPHGILDWRGADFTKLEDFWNRNFLRTGGRTALNNDLSGGTYTLGLAEFCNGNFIGQRAVYGEFFSDHNDIHYFAFPSLADTTQSNLQEGNLWGSATHGDVTLENFKHGTRLYISKTNAGVTVTYHSALSYLIAEHPGKSSGLPVLTIADDNVLSNYHALLIPKAVEYSAGLLDYFFRGTLDVGVTDNNDGTYSLYITNTSSQNFSGGGFHLFYDDTNGVRTEVSSADFSIPMYSGSLATGGMAEAFFTPRVFAADWLLVYQGSIGMTDPVDMNIAIAVAKFNISFDCGIEADGVIDDSTPADGCYPTYPAQRFPAIIPDGQAMVITMTSPAFNPWIDLLDGNGGCINWGDGGNGNSISITNSVPGNYIVQASTSNIGDKGSFHLSTQCGWLNDEETTNITCPSGRSVSSTIAAGTVFSAISKDDANQQAMTQAAAQAVSQCCTGSSITNIGDLTWTTIFSYQINNVFTNSSDASGGTVYVHLYSGFVDDNGAKGFLNVTSGVFCVEEPYDISIHAVGELSIGDFNGPSPATSGGIIVYVDGLPVYSVVMGYGTVGLDQTATHTLQPGQHSIRVLLYNEVRNDAPHTSDVTITITPASLS